MSDKVEQNTADATEVTSTRGRQRQLQGVVRSTKAAKTAIVEVNRRVLHSRYKKYINRRARYVAHDERSECQAGDTVQIISCRPLSRNKRWRIQRIVDRPA